MSERAEITTMGARHTEVDGMSQMSFHTQSRFGQPDQIDDGTKSNASGSNTVYTKPFTVQSAKGSDKSKMQKSTVSKPGTEVVARTANQSQIIKKKDRQNSKNPENASQRDSQHEAMGTIAPTSLN